MPHRRPAAHGGARLEGEPPAGACVDAIHRQASGLTGLTGLPRLTHGPQRLSSSAAPSEAGLRCLTAFGPAGLVRRRGAPEGPASFEPGRCPVQAPLQKQIFHVLDREAGGIAHAVCPEGYQPAHGQEAVEGLEGDALAVLQASRKLACLPLLSAPDPLLPSRFCPMIESSRRHGVATFLEGTAVKTMRPAFLNQPEPA